MPRLEPKFLSPTTPWLVTIWMVGETTTRIWKLDSPPFNRRYTSMLSESKPIAMVD